MSKLYLTDNLTYFINGPLSLAFNTYPIPERRHQYGNEETIGN